MRYTELRISDAALLTSDRLEGSRLRLHQIKAGEWVVIQLPLWLSDMFRRIRPTNGYLFCRGSKRLETVTDLWRRRINQVFDEAGIEGTPHQFRHTFAVDFLSKGVSIEHVSTLLAARV